MKLKKVSDFLIGGYLEKGVLSKENELLLEKGTFLNEQNITLLKKHDIKTVLVSIQELEKELYFQIERLIIKSSQPLFWESYLELLEDTKKFFFSVHQGNYNTPNHIIKKLHEMLIFLKDEKEFFEFNYSINGHEDSLYRHSVNVAILSFIISKQDTSFEDPYLLAKMGYFHDIGKMALDLSILDKKSPLKLDEITYLRKHTELGAEIIRKLNIQSKEIQKTALLHHESRLGNGYPFGYKKEDIPFFVQIVTTADIFDSICSDRIYKKKKTFLQGFNEIYYETVQGRLNPLIVFPFIKNVLSQYENKKIILNNGVEGIISHHNKDDIIRPVIELKNGKIIDLSKQRELFIVDFVSKEKTK